MSKGDRGKQFNFFDYMDMLSLTEEEINFVEQFTFSLGDFKEGKSYVKLKNHKKNSVVGVLNDTESIKRELYKFESNLSNEDKEYVVEEMVDAIIICTEAIFK